MSLIILAAIFISLCYKWGDWKSWRLYYSTFLFYIIGALTAHILTSPKDLWLIHFSFWNNTFANYFIAFFIFPCIITLFLTYYPKQIFTQVVYILSYVFALSLIEYIAYIKKAIYYYNGWTFGWSVLLYLGMFSLFRLHYKSKGWAWFIFFLSIGAGVIYFKIPLSSFK